MPRVGALLGVASLGLLVAALELAHHWSAPTLALVAAWGTTTLAALALNVRLVRTSRLAGVGLVLALVSIAALLVSAAGGDPTGGCGGG